MEKQNSLGIYITANKAFVVVLTDHGNRAVKYFSVSVEPDETSERANNSLATEIGQKLSAGDFTAGQVSIAVDCAMFTQHDLRSEFTDARQIAHTIAFDAEEALAVNASETALAFHITNSDQNGSDIAVFSAKRDQMMNILDDLQPSGIDPAVIEPDIVTLARFLGHKFATPEKSNSLFAVFSDKACYIIAASDSSDIAAGRSFLVASSQDKTGILTAQIPLTIAAQKGEMPFDSLFVAGAGADEIDTVKLAERLGLEVGTTDFLSLLPAADEMPDDSDTAGFIFACGAGLGQILKTPTCDFRRSFAPYEGKKLLLQKTLRFLAICVAVGLVAAGLYFQLKVLRKNNDAGKLKDKLQADYAAVMYGKEHTTAEPFDKRLGRVYTQVQKKSSGGIDDEQAVTAKLTFILEVLNECPKGIGLNIESIKISSKTITISGDTNGRKNTLKLLDYFNKHPKLKLSPQKILKPVGARDAFVIHLEPN
jgi:hypothetical protein